MSHLRLTAALGILTATVLASAARRPKVPRAEDQPTLTAKEGMAIYRLSKVTFYAAVRCGDIPSIRIGGLWVLPTAAVRRHLGLDGPEPEEAAAS